MSHFDDRNDEPLSHQTELTLSPSILLGLGAALIVLCAAFFFLGYSMHRSGPTALPAAASTDVASPDANFNSFKPAAGTTTSEAARQPNIAVQPSTATPSTPVVTPVSTPPPAPKPQPAATVRPTPTASTDAPLPTPVVSTTTQGFYVQVAAVSKQQDAESLVNRLHASGYLVFARTEPSDSLFHVQIGPYATRKDADLVRQKLAGEGYTAIIK
jgi:DedD protein